MRRYETIIIIDPDIEGEEESAVSERLVKLVPDQGGFLIKSDRWGFRKLAYEIRKKWNGIYVLIDYCGSGELVNEMERFCRIDERVLKYMTVLTEKEPDIEAIKKEMREAEEAEKAKSEAQPSLTDPAGEDGLPYEGEFADADEKPPVDETEKKENNGENDKNKEEE